MKKYTRFIKFLFAGLPGLILGFGLNYLLVSQCKLNISIAYAIVILLQITLNFFMCRIFVFDSKGSAVKQYTQFTGMILLFRIADWLMYLVLVNVIGIYYLLAQLINVFIFSALKYIVAKKIMHDV
jgi:putative flippase GtrA